MKAIVCKSFQAGDNILKTGDKVNTEGWKHVKFLIEHRYIQPLGDVTVEEIAKLPKNDAMAKQGIVKPKKSGGRPKGSKDKVPRKKKKASRK